MNFHNSQFQLICEQIMNTNMVTERGGTCKARPMPNSIKISPQVNYISSINHGQFSNRANLSVHSQRLSHHIEQNFQARNSQNVGASFHNISAEWTTKKEPKFSEQQKKQEDGNKFKINSALRTNKSLLESTSLKKRTYIFGEPLKSLLLPILKEPTLSNVFQRPYVSTGHIPQMIPQIPEDSDRSTLDYASSNGMNRSSFSTDISSE